MDVLLKSCMNLRLSPEDLSTLLSPDVNVKGNITFPKTSSNHIKFPAISQVGKNNSINGNQHASSEPNPTGKQITGTKEHNIFSKCLGGIALDPIILGCEFNLLHWVLKKNHYSISYLSNTKVN